jgi:hypothetical protein
MEEDGSNEQRMNPANVEQRRVLLDQRRRKGHGLVGGAAHDLGVSACGTGAHQAEHVHGQ